MFTGIFSNESTIVMLARGFGENTEKPPVPLKGRLRKVFSYLILIYKSYELHKPPLGGRGIHFYFINEKPCFVACAGITCFNFTPVLYYNFYKTCWCCHHKFNLHNTIAILCFSKVICETDA